MIGKTNKCSDRYVQFVFTETLGKFRFNSELNHNFHNSKRISIRCYIYEKKSA